MARCGDSLERRRLADSALYNVRFTEYFEMSRIDSESANRDIRRYCDNLEW